nr:cation:proton antiporter [Clostridiales bacterium]
GLLIGKCVLRLLDQRMLASLSIVTTVALGFIAFSIGGEFKRSSLKKLGTSVITITLFESCTAVILVDLCLIIVGAVFKKYIDIPLPLSITLGAISAATAPAATLMVVRQYKAHGPVTNILLPVVALDDAVCLIVFSISLSIAKAITGGKLSVVEMLLKPILNILLSLVVGGIFGLLLSFFLRFFKSRANRKMLAICFVILGSAVAEKFGLSQLLLCMAIGAVFANFSDLCDTVLDLTEQWTPPLFMLFFVISGADLDFTVLPKVGVIGVIYIFVRVIGKYFGAGIGSAITKQEPAIRKYLGIMLFPQAGVAIGVSQIVVNSLPEYGQQIRAVILSATLIYEFVGPVLTKITLLKAGEIEKQPSKLFGKNKNTKTA